MLKEIKTKPTFTLLRATFTYSNETSCKFQNLQNQNQYFQTLVFIRTESLKGLRLQWMKTIFVSAATNNNVKSSHDKNCNILDVKTLEISKGLEIVFSEPKGDREIVFTFLVAH